MHEAPLGSAVGATLGLLAFMLGFTFQIVGNRYDHRKELLVNEISGIRTFYLYAGLVPEPIRSDARRLIVEYVDLRVAFRDDPSKFESSKVRSMQILDTLWKFSELLAAQDRSSEAYALFMTSARELVVVFNERITVIYQFHLPKAILYILCFVGFFSMLTLGYQFGVSGKVSMLVTILLGTTFAGVMWLIFALDQPSAGIIQISDAPLRTLHMQLHGK